MSSSYLFAELYSVVCCVLGLPPGPCFRAVGALLLSNEIGSNKSGKTDNIDKAGLRPPNRKCVNPPKERKTRLLAPSTKSDTWVTGQNLAPILRLAPAKLCRASPALREPHTSGQQCGGSDDRNAAT